MRHRRRRARADGPSAAGPIALVLGAALAGCGADDGRSVEVDLFSGRENPSFTLETGHDDTLTRTIDHLTPEAYVPLTVDRLDFRGFVVSPEDADGQAYRVLPGVVMLEGSLEGLADPQDLAYELLMQAAGEELSAEDAAALRETTGGD